MVFIEGMVVIEGVNGMVFIEGFHQRQVIISIHCTNLIHKIESQYMDRVEDGTHDAILSII